MKKQMKTIIGVIALVVVVVVVVLFTTNSQLFQGKLLETRIANEYPVSTNLMLKQWSECENNRNRMLLWNNEEDVVQLQLCANYQPQVWCNANVWGKGGENDTDRDGISNFWEYQMGLNPCEKYSVGGTIADGDFDYDNDGILNKNDSSPICNMQGLYPSDCV